MLTRTARACSYDGSHGSWASWAASLPQLTGESAPRPVPFRCARAAVAGPGLRGAGWVHHLATASCLGGAVLCRVNELNQISAR